ncbi:MAG: hypothetical protein M1838_005362 [Thelocarpon superellum]|nr:MAG: hypothetical protein M1838_005362 [Thelocarpon superellum]
MSSWLSADAFFDRSLPAYCEPTTPFLAFLSSTFQTCVPTPLALLSTALGCLSIAAWLFAQLPQIVKNYSLQSTSGLSIYFLVEWCLGDTTNFLGAIFTRQARWQVIVAGYYVFVDVILVSQYAWYTYLKPRRRQLRHSTSVWREEGDEDGSARVMSGSDVIEGIPAPDDPMDASDAESSQYEIDTKPARRHGKSRKSHNRKTFSFRRIPTFPCLSSFPSFRDGFESKASLASSTDELPPLDHAAPSRKSSRSTLLAVSLLQSLASARPLATLVVPTPLAPPRSQLEVVGSMLAWTSTLLYLASRLPQIYKNHMRRSTSGLSAKLFIAAFFGNLFYSSSILTDPCAWNDLPAYGGHGWAGPEGSQRAGWIARATPFWLGAAGVLGLDATVGMQFLMFGEREPLGPDEDSDGDLDDELVDEVVPSDDEGKGSGWIGGWTGMWWRRNFGVRRRPSRSGAVVLEGEYQRLNHHDDARDGSGDGNGTRSYGSLGGM